MGKTIDYSARQDYQSNESALNYERRSMYQGWVGARRKRIETQVINSLVTGLGKDLHILDLPCGNGRWFDTLSKSACRITAIDVSEGMVLAATLRAQELPLPINVSLGDAEKISLPDDSVDAVFSYALMKHLPRPVQYNVMREFSRVTRRYIICSFALINPLSYLWWKHRKPEESYPLMPEELLTVAKACDIELLRTVKVSQPVIGLEYFAVFENRAKCISTTLLDRVSTP